MNKKDLTSLIEELLEETLEEAKKKKAKKKKSSGKKDACYHKVKSRYKVWPSAYASGALVRCRKVGAKNWGKSTNEGKESEPYREEEDSTFTHDGVEYSVNKALERTEKREAKTHKIKDLEWILDHDKPHEGRLNAADLSAPVLLAKDSEGRTTVVDGLHRLAKAKKEKKESIQGKFLTVKDLEYAKCEETLEEKKRKLTKKPSSETNLGDWFKRKGAKGSSGGWVDCNAPDGKGGYKTCGRKKGEKRSKYPACRPTPSACKSKGKGKSWGKKASKRKNESMNNLQQLIENEILSILNESNGEESKKVKMKSLTFLLLTRMKPGTNENPKDLKKPLKGLGLDKLSWLNPLRDLSKKYNPAKDRDPLFLEFKKEGGRYKVVSHEGRHRNLGNILTNGQGAEIKVELKGDIPPSGTEVLAQDTGKGVQISYEELEEVESTATESFDLEKELSKLDKTERNLNDIFSDLNHIGGDYVTSLDYDFKGWDIMVEKFNKKYRIRLSLDGNEPEDYKLVVTITSLVRLKISPLSGSESAKDISDDDTRRARFSKLYDKAQIVDNNESQGISEAQDNIQEQILQETIKLLEATNISEGMQYHLDNKIPITETVYRPLSEGFMRLMKEARTLYSLGLYEGLSEGEREILESDLGEVDVYEGERVPLDLPMVVEEDLDEAKYKGKDVSLGKPTRGDVKKYKVYVRNKNGKVIKVNYGSKDMKGNWNDPKARKSFAARHKCAEKKDKTKPSYWSCRAHKHFGKNVSGAYW